MQDIYRNGIVVIGVSNKAEKYGFKIFKDLIEAGYDVKGVHPADVEVLGKKIYRSLEEIETAPDLVITVVPPKVTENIVDVCKEKGIKAIWMQPGSESDTAIEKAKRYGISVTYNACFMVQKGVW